MDAMEALLVQFCVDCIMPFFCAVQALYRIRDGRHGGVISVLLCGIHYGFFSLYRLHMHVNYALNMRSAFVEALYRRYICVSATAVVSAGIKCPPSCIVLGP